MSAEELKVLLGGLYSLTRNRGVPAAKYIESLVSELDNLTERYEVRLEEDSVYRVYDEAVDRAEKAESELATSNAARERAEDQTAGFANALVVLARITISSFETKGDLAAFVRDIAGNALAYAEKRTGQ